MIGGHGVALVTGSAGAIGSATVRAFVAAGFVVAGFDRDRPHGADDAAHHAFRVDLEDDEGLAAAVAEAEALGPLRHVVGVAGGALPAEPATADDPLALDITTFRASIDANLLTQFRMLRAVLPWMRRQNEDDRSVTFTSSLNGLTGWGMPAYSAAKAGLIGMTRALVLPLGREGIRINVVAPGTVRTPRTERMWSGVPGHFERLERSSALGRLTTPEDVARAFVALATVLTQVTGQTLVVDGGQSVLEG